MLQRQGEFETRYVTANSGADRLRLLLGGNADIALFAASEYIAQGEGLKALVYFGKERLLRVFQMSRQRLSLAYDVSWANPNCGWHPHQRRTSMLRRWLPVRLKKQSTTLILLIISIITPYNLTGRQVLRR